LRYVDSQVSKSRCGPRVEGLKAERFLEEKKAKIVSFTIAPNGATIRAKRANSSQLLSKNRLFSWVFVY